MKGDTLAQQIQVAEQHLQALRRHIPTLPEQQTLLNVLSMNPAALRIHGFERVEEAQQHLYEYPAAFTLHYLDDRLVSVEEWPLTRVLRGETFAGYEVQVWRANTGHAWIASYSGTLVRDKASNMILGVLTWRDITAQKEADLEREQLLSRVEQEWQRAQKLAIEVQQRAAELDASFAAIADGVLIYGLTGEITRMNPAAEKIFGYSLAVRDPHSDQLVGVSARAAPIQAPDGRMLGAVASYADITELCRARDELELRVQERTAELTQANAALCESERAYRTLAENLPGIVYRVFVRENNRLQFFNKVAPKVTGYAEEELAPGQICSIEPHIRIAFATSRTGTLSHGA